MKTRNLTNGYTKSMQLDCLLESTSFFLSYRRMIIDFIFISGLTIRVDCFDKLKSLIAENIKIKAHIFFKSL